MLSKLQTEGHRHIVNRDSTDEVVPFDSELNGNLCGYRFNNKFHIFPAIFKKELCGDYNNATVCNVLDGLGYLDNGSGDRP